MTTKNKMAAEDSVTNLLTNLCKERNVELSKSSLGDPSTWSSKWPPLMLSITENIESEVKTTNDSGQAVINFKNKSRYEGSFDKGLLKGKGRYQWEDGTTYEGDFTDNKITGYGLYQWPDGSWYEGQVLNGLRHGSGTFHCTGDHVSYNGEWYMGKRHGKGKIVYDSEGSYYEGEWVDNTQCGYGTRQYRSGNVYEGQWKDGCRHGNGTMYWKDRNEHYSGDWVNGIQHGTGRHVWSMSNADNSQYPISNHYIGQWRNGQREGWGTFYYASGGHFEGVWLNNKKNGRGQYTLPNGRVIKGMYRDDKLVNRVGVSGCGTNDRPCTPLGNAIGDIDEEKGSSTEQFKQCISQLLVHLINDEEINEEIKSLHSVILRYLTQLRKIYHFYSSLGPLDSCKLIKRIQMWQFYKDCELHRHGLTLIQIDSIINPAVASKREEERGGEEEERGGRENKTGSDVFLMREFLQCLVFLSHHIYNKNNKEYHVGQLSSSLDLFMRSDCLPRACNVTGQYYSSSDVFSAVQSYITSIKNNYDTLTKNCPSLTLTKFLSFAKANLTSGYLTPQDIISTAVVIQPLAYDQDGDYYNMELSIVFLEFLEGLLEFASIWYHKHHEILMMEKKKLEIEEMNKKEKENEEIIKIASENDRKEEEVQDENEGEKKNEIEKEEIEKEEEREEEKERKEEREGGQDTATHSEVQQMKESTNSLQTVATQSSVEEPLSVVTDVIDTFFKLGLKNFI